MKRKFDPAVRARCEAARQHPNVRAMFMAQRFGESYLDDRAWTIRWGGTGQPAKTFTDLTTHPRLFEPGPNGPSSAAGAFQITATTYDEFAPWIGVTGFAPEDQELLSAAIMLAERALDDVLAGRFDQAVAKLGGRWASFPSSKSGQKMRKLAALREVYVNNGGTLADEQPAAPIEERDLSGAPPRSEGIMSGIKDWFSGAGQVATAAAPIAGMVNPAIGLALGLAGKMVEMFEPLAKEKLTQELSRHTDPAIAAKVADNMLSKAKELAQTDDEVAAVAAVRADPNLLTAVQEDVLDDLERMEPMLKALHARQKDAWDAEEDSRDRAAARARREPWDMTRVLVLSMLFMVLVSFAFLFWLAGYQAMNLESKEPTALIWSSIVFVLGVVTGIWLTVIAYRFGSSRSAAANDAQLAELARRGMRPQ